MAATGPEALLRGLEQRLKELEGGLAAADNSTPQGAASAARVPQGELVVPEAEVVTVVLPDGDVEVRLASINLEGGVINLRQIDLDSAHKVVFGGEAAVKIASIGTVSTEGGTLVLTAHGETARVLLKLHFDGDASAGIWSACLHRAMSAEGEPQSRSPPVSKRTSPSAKAGAARTAPKPSSSRASPTSARPTASPKASPTARNAPPTTLAEAEVAARTGAAATYQKLIEQQEEQVRLLETINERKEEQIVELQNRVENVLGMLAAGQQAYQAQTGVMKNWEDAIQTLRVKAKMAGAAEAACTANFHEATSGASAARATRARKGGGA